MSRNEYLMHVFHAIGEEIDEASANTFVSNLRESGLLSSREAKMIQTASGYIDKNNLRADMLRQIILTIME